MLTLRALDTDSMLDAASVVAREQAAARTHRSWTPVAYTDPEHCRVALEQLVADGYIGVVAHDERRCRGVICGRTFDSVGFVPAHGLAIDTDAADSTAVVVALLAEIAPVLLADGAARFTIDHVALDHLGVALSDAGFGRGGVFATQPPRPAPAATVVDVRVGTAADLDAIASLSQIEYDHRSTPPIYTPSRPRTLAEARDHHEQLIDDGAVHFLARRDDCDVGLVTVEFTSPAPRVCQSGQPYIGPTASHPSVRGHGIGSALVAAVLDWADVNGYETVSVDFDSANPLSRPFWLGMGFEPTGYRARRTIDPAIHARTGD